MMQPRSDRIASIAESDPIAAYGILMGIPRTPIVMNMVATFSSLAVPQPYITAALDQVISQRTWIDSIKHSILVPTTFAGNVFKTVYDSNLLAAPGVSAQIICMGGPKYYLCPTFTPLENIVDLINQQWPAGWPLYKQQALQGIFQLTQTQPGSVMTVTLSFRGWQFLDPLLDEMNVDTCARRLRNAGYFVPGDLCRYDRSPGADPNQNLGAPPDDQMGIAEDRGIFTGDRGRR